MLRIIFVRHGESELNVLQKTAEPRFNGNADTPLTQKGRDQADAIGRQLAARTDIRLQAAMTSTLSRSIETARIALQHVTYDVPLLAPDLLWNERSLGDFENRLINEVYAELPHYRDDPAYNRFRNDYVQKAPNGENFTDVTTRAVQGLAQIEETFDGDVAVFTHANLLRCMLAHLFQLSHTQSFGMRIPNAHPIIVTKDDDEFILEGELRID